MVSVSLGSARERWRAGPNAFHRLSRAVQFRLGEERSASIREIRTISVRAENYR
jgi:hypothetical protein